MENDNLVQSVVTANALLEALAGRSGGSTLSELARQLGMHPSRVLRHLTTLVELKLVERTGQEPQYRLGIKLVRLAERAQRQHDVTRLAYPAVERLCDAFGQATYLTRLEGHRSMVWLSLEGDGPHLRMPSGMWSSLTGSATGRVLLAFTPGLEVDEPLRPDVREGYPDPITSPAALADRLDLIRARGFDGHGVGNGAAIFTLAAPILDYRNVAIGVLAVAGFSLFLAAHGQQLLEALTGEARQLSSAFGADLAFPPAELP